MQGLNLIDLEDLLEDIKVYCEIERDTNTDFWIVSHTFDIGVIGVIDTSYLQERR